MGVLLPPILFGFLPSPRLPSVFLPALRWQEGLLALEALLRRRTGVDTWTTEDVVSWLRDIGLWSENTEREVRDSPAPPLILTQGTALPLCWLFSYERSALAKMNTAAEKENVWSFFSLDE